MMLEKTLRWIVLGGIFALPFIVFIVLQSLFFPFITGKNFAFRIIVEVITGAWLALAFMNPVYRPRRSWLLAAFSVFVIIIALADAFGVYPFKSFWSNFERMDGWITLAHLFLYFVVAYVMLSTEKLWRTFFQVSLAVSAVVGAYALLQLFGIASLNLGFSSAARLDATFGNPIYLASYMLFHVFLGALLLSQLWREGRFRTRTSSVAFYVGVVLFDTIILFLTGTRGAILGFIGGVVLAALLFMLSGDVPRRARQVSVGVIAFVLLSAGGLFLGKDQSWVRNAPMIGRLATISLEDSTTRARIMNWGTAWQGVKERPILGWGQENFAVVFNKYYNPQMYGQEQWFDRVHNVIFDWLIAGGFLGLFAYLSLFVLALFYLWRRKEADSSSFTMVESSILTGLLAAYFFHNLFVFDNIISYILFVSVLGYLAFRASAERNAPRLFSLYTPPANFYPIAVAVAVVIVWGGAWFVNAKALAANRTLLQSLTSHEEGVMKNLEYFKKAISYGSFGTQEAREQLVQAAAQLSRAEEVPLEVKQAFVETAAQEMSLQVQASPFDPRFPIFLGSLLDTYGLYAQAEPVLSRARELAPKKQTILFEVAANALARGETAESLATYKEAFELAPDFQEALLRYTTTLIRAGESQTATELLEGYIQKHPENIQVQFTLGAAYYESGNLGKAIGQLDKAAEINPAVKEQVESLKQEMRTGAPLF